jgi:hypothetical protein
MFEIGRPRSDHKDRREAIVNEEVKQAADWQTYSVRLFFLLGLVISSITCWKAEKSMPGFQIKLDIAGLWLFSALTGATIWLAPKRGQMSKGIADSLLLSVGFILMSLGGVVGRLVEYAQPTEKILK